MLKKITIGQILLIGLLFRILLVFISAYHPDLPNHLDWGNRFLTIGPARFYENIFWNFSWPNQPFGTILLFGLMAWLNKIIFSFFWFINTHIPAFPSTIITILSQNLHVWLVKLPFILSDIGIAYIIYKIVTEISPRFSRLAAFIFLFNPIVLYNSAVWGQTDSLINFLCLFGFYLTYTKKYLLGPFIFLSSFLFKLSLITYLPVLLILLFHRRRDFLKFLPSIVLFCLALYLLAMPFAVGINKSPFDWLWYMYNGLVFSRQGHMLNGNAFNLWFIIYPFDMGRSELITIGSLTAQRLGQLMTVLFLLPVYLKTLFGDKSLKSYLIALFLTGFVTFVFLTNIHERYLYPIFPLITILLFTKDRLIRTWQYVLLSIIHLFNLYNLWFYPYIGPIKVALVSNNFLICRILSVIIFVIFMSLYVQYFSADNKKT